MAGQEVGQCSDQGPTHFAQVFGGNSWNLHTHTMNGPNLSRSRAKTPRRRSRGALAERSSCSRKGGSAATGVHATLGGSCGPQCLLSGMSLTAYCLASVGMNYKAGTKRCAPASLKSQVQTLVAALGFAATTRGTSAYLSLGGAHQHFKDLPEHVTLLEYARRDLLPLPTGAVSFAGKHSGRQAG